MDVKDKGVFLTGGARGLGRGMCQALLEKGAKVLFCDVNADTGRAAEAELQGKYGADHVIFSQCDVTDADQMKASFQRAVSQWGAVDICVNNAGVMDERIWEKMIQTNTMGQIRGSQLALEHMRRDEGGRGGVIVNTVSMAGLIPCHWFPAYCASKHAVVGYTTSWARNPMAGAMGVRWCCLCPVSVNTDMMTSLQEDQIFDMDNFRERAADTMLQPEEVVQAFMRLVEDSDNNGAILEVWRGKGATYRKRQLVDMDGVSNPMVVDNPSQTSLKPSDVK
ncbi:15-hydroxyprostaglandin dehydrogenase [NAD(+)]-like [Littorina saxatilis]|uniref:15-hydroxyprostaglandin dehydrogenase [NAD(+)] n=1 Tax=Littorina saxatilis TaxID=31220 RepID=A0AAN9GQ98_9CAEN